MENWKIIIAGISNILAMNMFWGIVRTKIKKTQKETAPVSQNHLNLISLSTQSARPNMASQK